MADTVTTDLEANAPSDSDISRVLIRDVVEEQSGEGDISTQECSPREVTHVYFVHFQTYRTVRTTPCTAAHLQHGCTTPHRVSGQAKWSKKRQSARKEIGCVRPRLSGGHTEKVLPATTAKCWEPLFPGPDYFASEFVRIRRDFVRPKRPRHIVPARPGDNHSDSNRL
jgi:hypothetical protein